MKETITYKGYIGSVHICEESECLYGKIEGIDDLISYEGDTVNALIKDFHESVDDYLALCKEVGKEPGKSYKGSFNVRLGVDLHRSAANMAMRKGVTLNQYVMDAVKGGLSVETVAGSKRKGVSSKGSKSTKVIEQKRSRPTKTVKSAPKRTAVKK